MRASIYNKRKTDNSEVFSEIEIFPETPEEFAKIRWMEEVFDMKQARIIPRYLGDVLSYAIIPERKN